MPACRNVAQMLADAAGSVVIYMLENQSCSIKLPDELRQLRNLDIERQPAPARAGPDRNLEQDLRFGRHSGYGGLFWCEHGDEYIAISRDFLERSATCS